jgi:hypothetical protein
MVRTKRREPFKIARIHLAGNFQAVVGIFVQPLSGLINHLAMTQGSPVLRGNPGLNDGTPLGF